MARRPKTLRLQTLPQWYLLRRGQVFTVAHALHEVREGGQPPITLVLT